MRDMPRKAASSVGKIPVVFLHGLGGSSRDWEAVGKVISRHRSVLSLDLPGGAKAVWHGGYDPASLAGWLAMAMDEHRISRAHLVGHSLGGRIAGELGAQDASRIATLSLVAPLGAGGYGLTDRLKWKAMSRTGLLRNVPESKMRSALGYGFVDETSAAAKGFADRAMASRKGPKGTDVLAALEKCVDGVLDAPPLSERLKRTTFPLLLVSGSNDPMVPPREVEKVRAARPHVKALILAGQGHYPMLEEPARLAEALEDFLESAS